MTWYVTQPLSDGTCGEPCNYGFHAWLLDPFHCPIIDDNVCNKRSPNWCEYGRNLDPNVVDSCPGLDVHVRATNKKKECGKDFDLVCSDYSKLC